jgi:hypothetical protein
MYIQLRATKNITVKGVLTTYHSGDWVDVGKQTARLWIAAGDAWVPPATRLELLPSDCAILVRGSGAVPANIDGIIIESMGARTWAAGLPHAYNLIYKAGTILRPELLQVGFNLLTKWDAVVPLVSYKQTAGQLGDAADREATKELIYDLRVPPYDTRLIFVRKNEAGESLLHEWWQQLGRDDIPKRDERLAFLRAFFIVKPRLCAAPVSWVGKSYDQ